MGLAEEGKAIAERLGNGVGYYGPWLPYGPEGEFMGHFFRDDAVTKTSFVAKTYEEAKQELINVRERFGAQPPVFSENPRKKGRNPGGETMDEIRAKQIAEEAAVKAVELQGSRIVEQVAKEISGELFHQSPISPHCEAVLETPPKCYDFRGIRSWVMCRAWDIMEKEKRTRLPVGEAWQEARRACVFEEERERRERLPRGIVV